MQASYQHEHDANVNLPCFVRRRVVVRNARRSDRVVVGGYSGMSVAAGGEDDEGADRNGAARELFEQQ
jgi:hypothetical protein